jgi:hypothetical protein
MISLEQSVVNEECSRLIWLVQMTEPRVALLIRIPAKLKAQLAELAERENRSLNRQIQYLLQRSIQNTAEPGEVERHPRKPPRHRS